MVIFPLLLIELDTLDRAAVAAHPYELDFLGCRASKFACVRVWNCLPNAMFESGTLGGFKRTANNSFLSRALFLFFCGVGACGDAPTIRKTNIFSLL